MTIPFLFFFLSGACALIYQVVWMRQLVLIVGTTTAAVSTVLTVFMAGLGLGAWLFGAVADRSRAPLKLYAYLELGIGLYALLLPMLITASTPAYVSVVRHLVEDSAPLLVVRVALGFLLLIVPTVLMGGTLPVLIRYVGRSIERFGTDLGLLYGANLVGGVAGSLAAGFVLIRHFGVQGASILAVIGNLGIGLAALVVAARTRPAEALAPGQSAPAQPRVAIEQAARPLLWTTVFLSGLLSIASEVVWTRILIFAFESTVYAFTLILATFLTGLAAGSRLFVALERRVQPLGMLAAALIAAGVAAIALAPVSTRSQAVIEALSSRFGWTGDVFLAGTAICTALVVLVPATLMGLVLPLGMRLLVDDLACAGRRVGVAYLVNTAGCVLGALLAGFALVPLLGLARALLTLAATEVVLGGAFLLRAELSAAHRRRLLVGSAVAVAAGFVVASQFLRGPNPFDPAFQTGGPDAPSIQAHHDGIGSSVSVVSYPGGEKTLRIDGFEASSNKGMAGYMPMMTHIPMLLHPNPRRVLVICFGTGATAGAGLLYPGVSVDAVDISRTVFGFAAHFAAVNHGVAGDPRARLIVDDGRNFLLITRERYDVITSEPMPPHHAGVVNLYSKEYYELARDRLESGGFVVQWLPMHLLTLDESLRILRTAQAVFPETTLWLHRNTGIIVARRDVPAVIDLARVAAVLVPGALRAELDELDVGTPLDFARLHAMGPAEIRAATSTLRPVTDDEPSLEFHRFRHPLQEYRGPFNREQARMMSVVYRWRADSSAPLTGATSSDVAAIAVWRKVSSQEGLAEVQRYWDAPRARDGRGRD